MYGELGNKIDGLWEIFCYPHDGRDGGSEADRLYL